MLPQAEEQTVSADTDRQRQQPPRPEMCGGGAHGWIPVVGGVDEFAEGVMRVKDIVAEIGRDPKTLEFTVFGGANQWRSSEEIGELQRVGADRVVSLAQRSGPE
jgi:hypothetical protein